MDKHKKETRQEKKEYRQPKLIEWGSIQEITKGGAGGTQDGVLGTET